MEDVVSVSDLSPLEAGITGATAAPFSCSTGCSGTGIANREESNAEKNNNEAGVLSSITIKGQKATAVLKP